MLQLRAVLRSLVQHPGLTGAAILALALGIGANTALFTVIKSLLLHPYPLPDADRLVAVLEREPKDPWFRVAPGDYFDLTRLTTSFAAVAAWQGHFAVMTDSDVTDQIWADSVTEHLFALLGAKPILGRNFQAEDFAAAAPKVALLSHHEWIDRFSGSPAVLGHTVSIDNEPRTILGIMPKGFILPGYQRSDVFLPFDPRKSDSTNRSNRNIDVCGLLRPGVSFGQAIHPRIIKGTFCGIMVSEGLWCHACCGYIQVHISG